MKLIAKTMAGLEVVLAAELEALGATEVRTSARAVHFEGNLSVLYRANFEARTALRILWPIAEFAARNEDELYRRIHDIDWRQYMDVEDTFAVDAVAWSEVFRHSKFAALKTKDAIADRFRQELGKRPSVNVDQPDLRVHVHISGLSVSVSLDSSGESLHRRGYRLRGGPAPINEALAAGMVMLSGWKAERPFIDAMCGSGTLLIEAALIAGGIPPQWQRRVFGFQKWKNYEPELWEQIRRSALAHVPDKWPVIRGYDHDRRALRTAAENIDAAHLGGKIVLEHASFEQLTPPPAPGLLMMNPPYDERIPLEEAVPFYKSIGDTLKQNWAGYDAWIISANLEALKHLGLRPSRRISLFNGPLECKFQKYELYSGRDRHKPQQP